MFRYLLLTILVPHSSVSFASGTMGLSGLEPLLSWFVYLFIVIILIPGVFVTYLLYKKFKAWWIWLFTPIIVFISYALLYEIMELVF